MSTSPDAPESQSTSKPAKKLAKKLIKRPSINVKVLLILAGFLLFWPLAVGVIYMLHEFQDTVDPMRFPEPSATIQVFLAKSENATTLTEPERCELLVAGITGQLRRELDSPFGWSVNDLLISPTSWLSARASRQEGVIYATRMLIQEFSPSVTKLGRTDKENTITQRVREQEVVYGADIWGFFKKSSEAAYRNTLEGMDEYVAAVREGEAVFNVRSDDLYNMLQFLTGEEFLGQSMGLLTQPNEEVPGDELDERVYYVQGVSLVLRDFLHALTTAYPEIEERGGAENMRAAFRSLDRICTFYPVMVLRGRHDSLMADHRGKMARYAISVRTRIGDNAEAMSR